MSRAYYNEREPYAAAWLRNLISNELIAGGDVDERDVRDVRPADLAGYTQCHFFAGIGVWSRALRLAGWPDDRPVWTGSCPCQPFSSAGRGEGFFDERHLWPHWFHSIRCLAPSEVFGEQVASDDGLNWLDLVSADLEGEGYAFGAADLCAAGFGAPHIRQRLFFVGSRAIGGMADAYGRDARPKGEQRGGQHGLQPQDRHADGGMGDASGARLPACQLEELRRSGRRPEGRAISEPSRSFWSDCEWVECRDRVWRPIEPGSFPLAHGASSRVGRLRAYGNAISPYPAAHFVKTYLEIDRMTRRGSN